MAAEIQQEDFLRRKVVKGDFVVFLAPRCRELALGRVIKVNAKSVNARQYPFPTPDSRMAGFSWRNKGEGITRFRDNFVVVTELATLENPLLAEAVKAIREAEDQEKI